MYLAIEPDQPKATFNIEDLPYAAILGIVFNIFPVGIYHSYTYGDYFKLAYDEKYTEINDEIYNEYFCDRQLSFQNISTKKLIEFQIYYLGLVNDCLDDESA